MLTSKCNMKDVLIDLKENKITLQDAVNELCDRIDANEPFIHALVPESNRRSRLLKDAEQLEERFPNRSERPPLFGLPIGVKDNIRVDGFPTKAGSNLPEQLFTGQEATVVSLLKEAGALIVGKTNTTEFAYFEPAATANPHNVNHTPGGSSSGSAAGVAAGMFALALGTQTIGSVIRPASFCGVVGYKPTFDRISTHGLIYFSRSVDHVGLFTQDVEVMEFVASVVCQGWDDRKLSETSKIPVLGVPVGPYLDQMTEEGLAQFEANLTELERSGYIIKRIGVFEDIERINLLQRELTLSELAVEHESWFDEYQSLYRQGTVDGIIRGKGVSVETVNEAIELADQLRNQLHERMDEYEIDMWICPPALGTAPKGLQSTGDPIMNVPWTFTGMPAMSVPVGESKNKLPIGLQLVTRYGEDEQLVAWAKGIQRK